MGREKEEITDVIVVDDRKDEYDDIRALLEACACRPHFYSDYRGALEALQESVATRLLLNYQLNSPKNHGAFILKKIESMNIPFPTIVINTTGEKIIDDLCYNYKFVKHVIHASSIMNRVEMIRGAFNPLGKTKISDGRLGMGIPHIFVIHGRNLDEKNRILNILNGFIVVPVVLCGEPIMGGTITDELDRYTSVDFAIALFTGDDEGREILTDEGRRIPNSRRANMRLRARQNVIYETGMLRSKLGEDRVLIFCGENVELPSDLAGVRYVTLKENDRQIADRLKQVFDCLGIDARLKRT